METCGPLPPGGDDAVAIEHVQALVAIATLTMAIARKSHVLGVVEGPPEEWWKHVGDVAGGGTRGRRSGGGGVGELGELSGVRATVADVAFSALR